MASQSDTGISHSPAGAVFDEGEIYARTAHLLGAVGPAWDPVNGPLAVHEALLEGLPGSALKSLVSSFRVLPRSGSRLEKAIGVSLRTIQRKKGSAAPRLTTEQAGRAWRFAEILAHATQVLGTQDAAERWLERPAIGLEHYSPLDLIATPTGARMVEDYLTQIEYGVYT